METDETDDFAPEREDRSYHRGEGLVLDGALTLYGALQDLIKTVVVKCFPVDLPENVLDIIQQTQGDIIAFQCTLKTGMSYEEAFISTKVRN